ncbi:hypothetical protein PHYBOEH_002699 [Phytophthora boehmeriae]|uniref:Uncharacterized protein n=1 Tax=Phytophthora boehmeriae TaxID=109152 RepID=A0A8T1X660_9STRA|nr:hypothetical protein PHYBOEH_002699 [Phytophthora boehmeriae]
MPAPENVEHFQSDTQSQERVHVPVRGALFDLTLSPQDAGSGSTSSKEFREQQRQRKNSDPMAKTKRRMFSAPMLRRSATASGIAAANAASKIKSNLTTKLPIALKRNSAAPADDAKAEDKATVERAPTVPSLAKANSLESKTPNTKKFGMPSLMGIKARTTSKDKTNAKSLSEPVPAGTECPLDSPEPQKMSENTTEDSEADTCDEASPPAQKANNAASRFVPRMPAMLKRVVSTGTAPVTKKASPDTSANSTPRRDTPDDPEENTRRSLLFMIQVPLARRRSQVPLMAASESW